MDEKLLISIGLSEQLARAYRLLVLRKKLKPSEFAKISGESRTNSYHILDSLVDEGLATKEEEGHKFVYHPVSPMALKSILSDRIAKTQQSLTKLEEQLPALLSDYHRGGSTPKVNVHRGKHELRKMYDEQMTGSGQDVHFIRSKADIAFFGREEMLDIRYLAERHKKRRYGITPIVSKKGTQQMRKEDARTGLKRTWIKGEEYTSPVEWVVSGDTVQAIYLDHEGGGVSIKHPEIAASFREILQLVSERVKNSPEYKKQKVYE